MDQVLPDKLYRDINKALGKLNEARLLTERMERCGDNCDELHQSIDEVETKLKAYKKEFFPDRP